MGCVIKGSSTSCQANSTYTRLHPGLVGNKLSTAHETYYYGSQNAYHRPPHEIQYYYRTTRIRSLAQFCGLEKLGGGEHNFGSFLHFTVVECFGNELLSVSRVSPRTIITKIWRPIWNCTVHAFTVCVSRSSGSAARVASGGHESAIRLYVTCNVVNKTDLITQTTDSTITAHATLASPLVPRALWKSNDDL